MILIVFQLCIALLAAFGLTAIGEAVGDERARRRLLGWTTALTAGVALLWVSGLAPDVWRAAYASAAHASRPGMEPAAIELGYTNMVGDIVRVGFLALVALVAVLATLRSVFKPRSPRHHRRGHAGRPHDGERAHPLARARAAAAEHRGRRSRRRRRLPRVQAGRGPVPHLPGARFQSNRYAGFGIASLGGYHAAKPALYQRFLEADSGRALQSPGAWRLLNVRYIVIPGLLPPESGFTEVFRGQQQVVYEFPGALPRATLVPAFIVAPRDSHLAIFRDPLHDAARVTMLTEDPGIVPAPGGTARIVDYGLNKVRIETDTPGPSILRLADLDFPGWRVTIDGKEARACRPTSSSAPSPSRRAARGDLGVPRSRRSKPGCASRSARSSSSCSCSAPRTGTRRGSGAGRGAAGRRPRPPR